MPLKTPHDEVIAMLSGAIGEPPDKQAQLASVFLGSSLGAFVDLKRSDEQILALCRALLQQIRAAMGDPVALAGLEMGLAAIRNAHGSDK